MDSDASNNQVGKLKLDSAQALGIKIADSRVKLYRVALAWCGDEMLADDLVQDTIASGITKSGQLRDESRLFPWLYSIMNNHWRGHLRSSRPQIEMDDEFPSEECGPDGACQELEIVRRVRHAVESLPVDQRQVISLVDLGEFSYCDVAEALDMPIGTVMSRLHRARKNLLAKLGQPESDLEEKRKVFRIVR